MFKLNFHATAAKTKLEEEYDPAAKYNHIYKTMCHNMNYVTHRAKKDFAIDETTWGFAGYCDNAGGRLHNKPKSKGGHISMVFDITHRYSWFYIHRHKKHVRPDGFNAEGPSEMHYLLNAIDARVAGQTEDQATFKIDDGFGHIRSYSNKVIYGTHPHGTADNHFSGSNV